MSLIEKLLEKQARESAEQSTGPNDHKEPPETNPAAPSEDSRRRSGFSPEALFDDRSETGSSAPDSPADLRAHDENEGNPLANAFDEGSPETQGTHHSGDFNQENIDWDQPAVLFEPSDPDHDSREADEAHEPAPPFTESPAPATPSPLVSEPNSRSTANTSESTRDEETEEDDILALFEGSSSFPDMADFEHPDTGHPVDEDTWREEPEQIFGNERASEVDTIASDIDPRTPLPDTPASPPGSGTPDFSDAALDAIIAGRPAPARPPAEGRTQTSAEVPTGLPEIDSPPSPQILSQASPPTTALKHIHIDIDRLDEGGIITPNGTNNKIAEEYRLIKRPLLLNILGEGDMEMEHPNLIMVTSSVPGEGKTFSSVNLAMSLAMELDRTVLLVDADVAKPSFSRVFDIEVDKGLIDILLGDASLEDTLLKTNIPKLTILPAGRRHQNSVELLGSEHMRSLTQELATRYEDRIIVFDSPPLLATTEAGVLAGLMSQIVLVVEANKTPHYVVRESLSQLDQSKYISLMLNKAQKNSGSGYYYYYDYNYKDSYYYGYE